MASVLASSSIFALITELIHTYSWSFAPPFGLSGSLKYLREQGFLHITVVHYITEPLQTQVSFQNFTVQNFF